MLPLALRVGEAEVDPFDLLVFDARKDSAWVGRHERLPSLFESVAPEQMPQTRRKAGRLRRDSSLGVQIPETARRVSASVNFSRAARFFRTRRRRHAVHTTLADWYSHPDHPAARALHASFLTSEDVLIRCGRLGFPALELVLALPQLHRLASSPTLRKDHC